MLTLLRIKWDCMDNSKKLFVQAKKRLIILNLIDWSTSPYNSIVTYFFQ